MKNNIAIIFVKIIGSLPLNIRRFLGVLLGTLIYRFSNRERTFANLQLKKFLKISNSEEVVKKMFQFFTTNFFETTNLFPILNEHEQLIKINNLELWNDLLAYHKPTIALTAHTGNWDLLAAYVVKRGANIITIGRMARGTVLQSLLKFLREKYSIKTIWKKNIKDTRLLLEESAGGTIMAVLLDQDIKAKGVFTNFFNYPCKTSTSLLELGRKLDARIITAFMFQEKNGSYQLFLREIDSKLAITEILQSYHDHLESLIRQYPEQWVWFHKRWRTHQLENSKEHVMSRQEYLKFLENI